MDTILWIIILWIVFYIIGLTITYQIFNDNNIYLQVGISYFIGNVSVISLIRVFSFIFGNFTVGMICTLIFCSIFIIICAKIIINTFIINYKQYITILLINIVLMFLICIFLSFCCVYGIPNNYNVYSHLGSAHSGRYINLAYDIVLNNRIPVVGQNYGQSILVAVGLLFGQGRPYFQLNLWISITISTFILFTYGFLYHLGISRKYSKIASIIIIFANTALSLNYIHIIDTGSPIIRSGYVDSHLGVIICILTLLYFEEYIVNSHKNCWRDYLFLFSMGIGCHIIGAYIGCIILVALLILLYCNVKFFKIERLYILMLFFVGLFGLGSLMGGVLTNSSRYDFLDFEGMITAQNAGRHFKIVPYLQYELGLNGIAWANKEKICNYISEINNFSNVFVWWYSIEQAFFEAVRLVFWPLIGSIGYLHLYCNPWKKKLEITPKLILGLNAIFLLLIGVGAAYGVEFGAKWWLTRLAAPGYYMGLLCLMIILFDFYKKNPSKNKYFIGLVFVIITFGPIINMILSARNQIILNNGLLECFFEIRKIYNFPQDIFY